MKSIITNEQLDLAEGKYKDLKLDFETKFELESIFELFV